jgi:dTDP-4-amino-4,6-dideoxygalactose transaminase
VISLSRPAIGEEEVEAVCRVLRSGQLAQGPEVVAFEEEFAAFLGPHSRGVHAVAASNGTTALQMALMALGIGPGDEVIVPAFTFIASANAVRMVGARPVFVDVEQDYFTIDPAAVEAAITPSTVGVMAVHLYGQPADLDALAPVASRHGLALVEDAAQAHGASLNGRRVGTTGVGCFSFYPTKNMTTGEGGIATTTDPALAERMRLARNHGMTRPYQYEAFGSNLRMTDIAAAIGRVQLRRLEEWNAERRRNAAWLDEHLAGVLTPAVRPRAEHVYHQYTVRCADRGPLLDRLREREVGFGIYYPTPIHRTAPHAQQTDLPVAQRLCEEVVSLPVRPGLSCRELEAVAAAVAPRAVVP